MIPRDDIVDAILKHLKVKRHVLLTGKEGVGKTVIIKEVIEELEDGHGRDVLYCEETRQFKPLLIEIARQLHQSQGLQTGDVKLEPQWEKMRSRLQRLSVSDLVPMVIESLKTKSYVLILDHVENIPASREHHIKEMLEVCTVIVISHNLKFFRAFMQEVEVPLFNEEESMALVEELSFRYTINATDKKAFTQATLRASNGNPAIMTQIYEDASLERTVGVDYVRSIQDKAGKQYMSMGWLLLVFLTVPMAARIVALGGGDRDGYVVFGVLTIFAMIMRYLVIKNESRNPS